MCTMMEKLLLLLLVTLTGINAQLDVCGRAPQNTRIVGGQNAPSGAWPWQLSLHFNNGTLCGGTLINNVWMLTAAHCFSSNIIANQTRLMVYLGREVQEGSNPNEVSRTVSQVIVHPGYNTTTGDNDIALVRLSGTVSFTNFIKPVCLAGTGSEMDPGIMAWVTGWGKTNVGQFLPSPQRLQEVEVPIVSNKVCNDSYGMITDNMLCAGQEGKDSCRGDAGGPLVVKNQSLWIACGLVSFSRGCGGAQFPGVYVRVSRYESWIKGHISTNQPGFVTVKMVSRSASSSIAGSLRLLALTLPLLLFLLQEV